MWVGVAIWSKCLERPEAGHAMVPTKLRRLWMQSTQERTRSEEPTDIFEIEAICPLVALCTWPRVLRVCLWLHWIDNSAAEATLMGGSSSVLSGDILAGQTWSRISKRLIWPWFNRVASESNPVDKLSRGDLRGHWTLVLLRFPQ